MYISLVSWLINPAMSVCVHDRTVVDIKCDLYLYLASYAIGKVIYLQWRRYYSTENYRKGELTRLELKAILSGGTCYYICAKYDITWSRCKKERCNESLLRATKANLEESELAVHLQRM